MDKTTWAIDFYLYSNEDGNFNARFYHILVQVINNNEENNDFLNKELMISIFYPSIEEDTLYFSFFCHFIFQSPHDLASTSIHSTSSIENISILGENLQENPKGNEKNILLNFKQNLNFQKYFLSSDIKLFDSEIHRCKISKKLGSGGFGQVFLGTMKFNLLSKAKNNIVFKETKFISYQSLKNLMNECMMMKIVENQFTIKLHGICIPSMRLLESRKKIHLIEENKNDFDEDEYLNHQLLSSMGRFNSLSRNYSRKKLNAIKNCI